MSVATPPTESSTPPTATSDQSGAHSDGGWGLVPVQTRSLRFTSNDPAEHPPVVGNEVEWKLSPVSLFRDLIDGELDGSPYEYSARNGTGASTGDSAETNATAPSAISTQWVTRDSSLIGSAGTAEEKSSANAWHSFERALAVTVASEEYSEITIDRSGLGSTPRAAHTVIIAEKHSRGLVVIQSTGSARLCENVEIVVKDGANLTVVSVQEWAADAVHLASHFVQVGRGATLRHIVVSLTGAVVRVNPSVHLSGEGADAELYGLYFADAGQHLEQRVYLHHQAAKTRGRVNYKGALQGTDAHTVWVGDVLIGRAASGTDSYEQNRTLVLSEGTRSDSIPNLEIETGDILGAGHASATGRFDDEQLFYLQSRGISEEESRRLVVIGFLSEIIQKIGVPELEERLHSAVQRELGAHERSAHERSAHESSTHERSSHELPTHEINGGVS